VVSRPQLQTIGDTLSTVMDQSFLLCCQRTQTPGTRQSRDRTARKVDENGVYLPFAGVTVVCHVLPSEPWTRLPERIEAIAGRWLSPLPTSSYHATVLAGPCQPKLHLDDASWEGYLKIRRESWARMDAVLCDASFAPSSLRPTKTRDLERWGLCVDFAANDPEEDLEGQKLRRLLRTTAQNCDLESRDRPWHVTLAYRRSSSGPIPPEVAEKVRQLVDTCLLESLTLVPAQLCYHPDMTAFVPFRSLDTSNPSPLEESHAQENAAVPKRVGRWRRS